eukprot:279110_1
MQNVTPSKRLPESELQSNTPKRQKVGTEEELAESSETFPDQELTELRRKLVNVENKLKQSEKLLSSIYDVLSSSKRTKLLHKACEKDKTEIVEYLLSSGMDVNSVVPEFRRNVLHTALISKSQGVVNFLLENQTNHAYILNVNRRDATSHTPLHYAAKHDWNPKVIESLLHFGADANAITNEDNCSASVLYLAVSSNSLNSPGNVDRLLSQSNINVNEPNLFDQTPLCLAAHNGNTEIVHLLLKHPDIDVNRWTNGIYVSGNNALTEAVKSGQEGVVAALLAHESIDVNYYLQKKRNARPALSIAASLKDPAIAKLLLSDERTDVNASDRCAQTALHAAASYGNLDLANLLLSHPKLKINPRLMSPFNEAVRRGNIEIVRTFLNSDHVNNLNIHDVFLRDTPLHCAARWGKTDIIRIILEHSDSTINVINKYSNTPLHCASQRRNIDAVRELLTHESIDVLALTDTGETARDLATYSNEVRELLTEAMQKVAILGLSMSWNR